MAQPLEQGWDEGLRRDINRLCGMEQLDVSALHPPYEPAVLQEVVQPALHALLKAVQPAAGSAWQSATITRKMTEAGNRAGDAIQAAISQLEIATPDEQQLQEQLTAVCNTCAQLQPKSVEGLLNEELKWSGGVGARCYGVSQQLTVRHLDMWRDAEVIDTVAVRFESGESVRFAPHPWNHAPGATRDAKR